MAGNNDPLFTKQGDLSTDGTTGMSQVITAAAADYTGIGANNRLVFTADATNGGYVSRIRCKATGTNVAAVLRVYLNNGSTNATATNNAFFEEISLPATTVSTTAATPAVDLQLGFALPPGWRIYVGLGAAVAAGWVVTTVGGKY
jgi:hypothetical protein